MHNAWLIIPEFGLILLGSALHAGTRWGTEFWRGLEKLVYFVLFPALLFVSIVRVPFDFKAAHFFLVGITITLAGVLLGYLAKPLVKLDQRSFASGVQCAFRFNSFLALAPAAALGGDAGVALLSLLIGLAVPLCNVASVWGLARSGEGSIARELLRNPLILATGGGLICNLLQLQLPAPALTILQRLGQGSIPLGLMAVGAGLRLTGLSAAPFLSLWFGCVKLMLLPALALLLAHRVELTPLQTQIVVMFAALPSATSSYILATRMGGNGPFVAFIVSATTIASIITLPFWLSQVSR